MTSDQLSAIEERNQWRTRIDYPPAQDIAALVAEVRRLQHLNTCDVCSGTKAVNGEACICCSDGGCPQEHGTTNGLVTGLRRLVRCLEAKCKHSLANNLCPDHRDKQIGKPCLACEVEKLQADVSRLRAIKNQLQQELAARPER